MESTPSTAPGRVSRPGHVTDDHLRFARKLVRLPGLRTQSRTAWPCQESLHRRQGARGPVEPTISTVYEYAHELVPSLVALGRRLLAPDIGSSVTFSIHSTALAVKLLLIAMCGESRCRSGAMPVLSRPEENHTRLLPEFPRWARPALHAPASGDQTTFEPRGCVCRRFGGAGSNVTVLPAARAGRYRKQRVDSHRS